MADHLVDIHGQHAWQSLTRAPSVRALLDTFGRIDSAPMAAAWQRWKGAADTLSAALERQADAGRERERLAWQVGELDKLAPGADEWAELNAEHQKLSNAQALIDAAHGALQAVGRRRRRWRLPRRCGQPGRRRGRRAAGGRRVRCPTRCGGR